VSRQKLKKMGAPYFYNWSVVIKRKVYKVKVNPFITMQKDPRKMVEDYVAQLRISLAEFEPAVSVELGWSYEIQALVAVKSGDLRYSRAIYPACDFDFAKSFIIPL